ncbi:MAG: PTS sugar transporter subunit IIA [Deferrisomatales bacterium]
MIGLLIVAHRDLGPALRRAAEGIVGPMERVEALSLPYGEPLEDARSRVESAVRRLDAGRGVLILTDMFGGTPTNVSLSVACRGRVEVLAGVNLPIVLKAQGARVDMELTALVEYLGQYGARNIVWASERCRPGAPCAG